MTEKRSFEDGRLKEGSFTVEAALVLPIVLFTLVGILWLFFFVHNRAFISAAVWEAAVLGSMEEMHENGDGAAAGEERIRERMAAGFYGIGSIRESVSGGDVITVICSADMPAPVYTFHWSFEETAGANVLRPALYIRRKRAKSPRKSCRSSPPPA